MQSIEIGPDHFEGDFIHLNNSTWFLWEKENWDNMTECYRLWGAMEEWCKKNCEGIYEINGNGLFFFDVNDALRFKLVFA